MIVRCLCMLAIVVALVVPTSYVVTRDELPGSDVQRQEAGLAKGSLLEFIEPDYGNWEAVRTGMDWGEVKRLLGDPLRGGVPSKEVDENPDNVQEVHTLEYGRLWFDSPAFPDAFRFYLVFAGRKVQSKHDPHGGVFSKGGEPTTPIVMSPNDRVVFDHYPRFVDARWRPSSGRYPIDYTIEVQVGQYEPKGKAKGDVVYHDYEFLNTDVPYCAFSYLGAGHGRWRVMARNAIGESDWSEWRYFRFAR